MIFHFHKYRNWKTVAIQIVSPRTGHTLYIEHKQEGTCELCGKQKRKNK